MMLDEDAIIYIIWVAKMYRNIDISDEKQFVVRQSLKSACEADRERRALRGLETADKGKPYKNRIIALFDYNHFK